MENGNKRMARNGGLIVQACLFIIISVTILIQAYWGGEYISPDSANYLREAEALISGHGMNKDWAVGLNSYFAVWPIGYPAMIAAVAAVTGFEVYLASKVLSIILLLLIHVAAFGIFRKDAWIYMMITACSSFVAIFCYTWSEQPFILGMLIFSTAVWKFLTTEKNYAYAGLMGFAALWLFMSRYIGMFALGCIGLLFLYSLIMFIRTREKGFLHKTAATFIAASVVGVCEIVYLYMNIVHAGYATGQKRIPAVDSIVVLCAKLVYSLAEDYSVVLSPAFTLSIPVSALIMLVLAVKLYFVFRNKELENSDAILALAFISIGVIYTISIAVMRFMSQFDDFGFRLLFPGTFCIIIGVIHVFVKLYYHKAQYFLEKKHSHFVIAILLCGILLPSPIARYANSVRKDVSYSTIKAEIAEQYKEVLPKSVVLFNPDPRVSFIRPDITFMNFHINYLNLIATDKFGFEEWLASQQDIYEHIYIYTGDNFREYLEYVTDEALLALLEPCFDTPDIFVEIHA